MRKALIEGGKRSVIFDTPCGFEIALLRSETGMMAIKSFFGNNPSPLTNSGFRLSRDGSLQLSHELARIYGDSDDHFVVAEK